MNPFVIYPEEAQHWFCDDGCIGDDLMRGDVELAIESGTTHYGDSTTGIIRVIRSDYSHMAR